MKKIFLNFWLDVLLLLSFLGIVFTGSVLKWAVPSHCGEGRGWRGGLGSLEEETSRWFLGIHRAQWLDIHFILSIALVVLILVHFILHWNWITCFIKTRFFPGQRPVQANPPVPEKDCH